jgi:hypothetical protein
MSPELERGTEQPRRFSIGDCPSRRLLHQLHLTRPDGTPRVWLVVLIAWAPLMLGAFVRVATDHEFPTILLDLSVHTRLLLGIPLLIVAERILEQRCRVAISQLYSGSFADKADLDPIIDRAERLRDSRLVEVLLVILVLAGGQALLWGLLGPTGLVAGLDESGELTFTRMWYVTVAWPIGQFLLLRWLWHWLIWSYVLVRLSRLPLRTIATHPDHAAGIGFLSIPIVGFATFVLAIMTVVASAWETKILEQDAIVQTFVPAFIAFVVLAAVVAFAPLVLFGGQLYRARLREIAQYNDLALDYVREFQRKWIDAHRTSENLIGTPDLQSLNDLCGAYESLVKVRLVPFAPRETIPIIVAALIPMLPLVATAVPFDKLVKAVGGALLGAIPM